MEQPIKDAEPETDMASAPVPSEASHTAQGETPPADVVVQSPPIEPAEPAEPGIYWCDEDDPGSHPILHRLQHGENDYTGVTHLDSLQAIGDLVAAGVLRKA